MIKSRTNITYKNLIMKALINHSNNGPLYIFIKLNRSNNETNKKHIIKSLKLNEEEMNMLLNVEMEVKFQLEVDEDTDEIYGILDGNSSFVKLVKLINSKYEQIIDKLINKNSKSNSLIATIKTLREIYGNDLKDFKDKVKISISDIVSLELTNNRVLNCDIISKTLSSPVYTDIYMYKDDLKKCNCKYVEQIFENKDTLSCEVVVNKYFDIQLYGVENQLINNDRLNFLLKGVPGTGKSTAVDIYLPKIGILKTENICRVNIHAGTSNSDLMQGIGIRLMGKDILYTEKQGIVLNFILRAILNPGQNHALVLEELQENSINEILGDLIYLIEERKRVKSSLVFEIKEQLNKEKALDGDQTELGAFEIINKLKLRTYKTRISP